MSSQESSPITQWRERLWRVIELATWHDGSDFDPRYTREEATQAITSATIELIEGLIPNMITSHVDHHFFDGSIPEKLETDKEQRAFGHGYNQALAQLRQSLKELSK